MSVGYKKRKNNSPLPIGVRQQIRKWLNAGKQYDEIKRLLKPMNVTTNQIANIATRRVKLKNTKREDAGKKRVPFSVDKKVRREISATKKQMRINQSVELPFEQRMRTALSEALTDLENSKLQVDDRITNLRNLSIIDERLHEREIESHLKRYDAQLIKALIRRFIPEVTDEDVLKIYREELAKMQVKSRE